jgi:hypothetical protein
MLTPAVEQGQRNRGVRSVRGVLRTLARPVGRFDGAFMYHRAET